MSHKIKTDLVFFIFGFITILLFITMSVINTITSDLRTKNQKILNNIKLQIEENRKKELEIAILKHPVRMENIAEELDLYLPEKEQVKIIKIQR